MAQVQDDIEQALPFMPTREEVQAAIVACWSPSPAVERVEVGDGLGRVLATGVRATYDCPPAQTAALDGIGVRFADVAGGGADTSGWVRGRDYAITDTGDDVPDDFDTVIPVEGLLFTDADGASFAGEKGAAPFDEGFAIGEVPTERGAHVNAPGSTFRAGDVVVPAGSRLTPERLSAAVAAGAASLEVLARPRVTVIPTGDELVEPGEAPARGRTINSNAILIASYARQLGADARVTPIVRDRGDLIDRALTRALATSDVVVINAGSSKGSEDCAPHVIAAHAAVVIHHGQKAAPGRPAMSAVAPDGTAMCLLPGPPVACDSAMRWLLATFVARWYGITLRRRVVRARVDADVPAGDFEVWRRCTLATSEDGALVAHVLGRGSSVKTLGAADGVILTPRDADLHAGDVADVIPLDDGWAI